MASKSILSLCCLCLLLSLFACQQKSVHSLEEYQQYMSSQSEAFSRSKQVSGVWLTATYLPEGYLAAKEAAAMPKQALKQAVYDSLYKQFGDAATFVFELKAEKATNLMKDNVLSVQEYHERVYTMGFAMAQNFELKVAEQRKAPVIVNSDHALGPDGGIRFFLQFPLSEAEKEALLEQKAALTLSYHDPHWNLGTNHFSFSSTSLFNQPKLLIP